MAVRHAVPRLLHVVAEDVPMPDSTRGGAVGGRGPVGSGAGEVQSGQGGRRTKGACRILLAVLLTSTCYRSWFDYADVEDDGDRAAHEDGGWSDGADAGPDGDVPVRCPAGMVFVPGGPFVMGADPEELSSLAEAEPEHEVYVSSFCMDMLEVTNAQWRVCVAAGGCTLPQGGWEHGCTGHYGADLHPVNCVSHGQARAYCAWAGKRLPTEAEWEKAARGGCEIVAPSHCGPEDERDYPWGEAPAREDCCEYLACAAGDEEVGSHPMGAGPYGALDLVGSVWEWVADYHDADAYASCADGCSDPTGPPYGDWAVVRGGFLSGDPTLLCIWSPVAWRSHVRRLDFEGRVGLRCAVRP